MDQAIRTQKIVRIFMRTRLGLFLVRYGRSGQWGWLDVLVPADEEDWRAAAARRYTRATGLQVLPQHFVQVGSRTTRPNKHGIRCEIIYAECVMTDADFLVALGLAPTTDYQVNEILYPRAKRGMSIRKDLDDFLRKRDLMRPRSTF